MAVEKANFEVNRMARLLGVSRSGFYRWLAARSSGPGPRAAARAVLDQRVREVHAASSHVYGAPRITAVLRGQGQPVNVKTVAASMRRQGLEGISPRAFRPVTTIAGVRSHRIGDLVERRWDTGVLNRVWVSDITYLPTGEGFLYLCVVIDGCSRRVVGWAMGYHQTADLVERAVQMAATLRGMLPADLVFHSDRGGQYVSAVLWELISRLGIAQSMGRNGVCFDNAMCESFWSTFKHEHYHRQYWATRAEARQGAARWIEAVYNRQRLHSTLGYQSPVAYEQQLIEQSNTMGQAA